jgi:phospholipase/lecithinase/hemolysin
VKNAVRLATVWCWLCPLLLPAQPAFTSLYVFGDGVSTTTNGPGGSFYYGNRYSNGRVWVEVLAQRQGLAYLPSRNWSYFGHYSPNLLTNLNNFPAPTDASTALFVVWVNNADFVYNMSNYSPYSTNNLAAWTNAMNRSLTNHLLAIQDLYAKGARTLILPNAVDITKVPFYVGLTPASKSFVRQRILDYNHAFANLMERARSSFSGITIHAPDIFALLDDLLARPADYGVTNALYNGLSVDALSDPALADKSLAGPGANYIYWDYLDPTAKVSMVIADEVQQLISPVRLGVPALLGGQVQLEVQNCPIGRDGVVESSTSFGGWTTEANFSSTNAVQTIPVVAAGSWHYYQLRFPFVWVWP